MPLNSRRVRVLTGLRKGEWADVVPSQEYDEGVSLLRFADGIESPYEAKDFKVAAPTHRLVNRPNLQEDLPSLPPECIWSRDIGARMGFAHRVPWVVKRPATREYEVIGRSFSLAEAMLQARLFLAREVVGARAVATGAECSSVA